MDSLKDQFSSERRQPTPLERPTKSSFVTGVAAPGSGATPAASLLARTTSPGGVSLTLEYVADRLRAWSATADPTKLALQLEDATTRFDARGSRFTSYTLRVTMANEITWSLNKRYSDFDAFHARVDRWWLLQTPAPSAQRLPSLPGKRVFLSSFDPDFIKGRQEALNAYLQALLREQPAVWQQAPCGLDFLAPTDLDTVALAKAAADNICNENISLRKELASAHVLMQEQSRSVAELSAKIQQLETSLAETAPRQFRFGAGRFCLG